MKAKFTSLIRGEILELTFFNTKIMNEHLDEISDSVEGEMKGRVGHNFPLSRSMINKYKWIKDIIGNKKITYVIAFVKGDILTARHERQHALYFYNDEYRQRVNELWDSLTDGNKKIIKEFLVRNGYHEPVFIDEFQAYLTTEGTTIFGLRDKHSIDSQLNVLRKRFNF